MKNDRVTVLGAGLAGCEAAFQLAERGVAVSLVEMRPERRSPAHKTDLFGELVCSNSLRSDRLQNGAGLLKEEMRRLRSSSLRRMKRACPRAARSRSTGRALRRL